MYTVQMNLRAEIAQSASRVCTCDAVPRRVLLGSRRSSRCLSRSALNSRDTTTLGTCERSIVGAKIILHGLTRLYAPHRADYIVRPCVQQLCGRGSCYLLSRRTQE